MLEFSIILLSILFGIILPALVLAFLLSEFVSIIFGAPYVSIPRKSIKKILAFGGISSDDILYDLGCGDGRILISGLMDFNVSRAVGYEVAFWPYLKTVFSVKFRQKKINVDLFKKNCTGADISKATFIYLYLFPKLVDKLAYKISAEAKPNIRVLCVGFPIQIAKHPEFKLLKSDNLDGHLTYLYKLKSPDNQGTVS